MYVYVELIDTTKSDSFGIYEGDWPLPLPVTGERIKAFGTLYDVGTRHLEVETGEGSEKILFVRFDVQEVKSILADSINTAIKRMNQ